MNSIRETKKSIFHDINPTSSKKIANNTYEYFYEGNKRVRFHQTDIIIYSGDFIRLSSGGYRTNTTRDRLNSFSPYRIYSIKGLWVVSASSVSYPFIDGMVFDLKTGIPDNVPPLSWIKQEYQDRKRKIDTFITNYASAISNLSAPSSGDCLYCQLSASNDNTKHGGDSLYSHVEENYQVPSLILAAVRQCGASPAFKNDTYYRIMKKDEKRVIFSSKEGKLFFTDEVYQKEAKRVLKKFFRKEGAYEIAYH